MSGIFFRGEKLKGEMNMTTIDIKYSFDSSGYFKAELICNDNIDKIFYEEGIFRNNIVIYDINGWESLNKKVKSFIDNAKKRYKFLIKEFDKKPMNIDIPIDEDCD